MAVHDIPKPDYPVDNEFYRQSLDLDLRDKREHTDNVLAAMGGISRVHFSRYKSLLHLSDEAIELADRHEIDEWRLRLVVKLAEADQAEMVKQIIQLNLSAKQIQAILDHIDGDQTPEPESLPKFALRLAAVTKIATDESGRGFAQALFQQDKDWNLARARIQMLKRIITEAEQFIDQQ